MPVESDGDMVIVHTKSSMMTMRQSVKRKRINKKKYSEYLSGMKKADQVVPDITIGIYYMVEKP
ncbi:MAG: hypothetical protein ACLVCH_06650 [Roseburia inulinivorans]